MQKPLTSTLKSASQAKAEDTCFEDTDPPFSPPEANPEENERDHCVDRIDDELTLVCRDVDVCYHGSHAIALISQQIGQRGVLRISRQQAARLRARLQLARDALLPFFPDADQRHVTAGLNSAEKFVAWWALSKDQRKVQPSHVSREHRLRVRWLQNALHNFSIIDELDEIAIARRDKAVASMKSGSGVAQ